MNLRAIVFSFLSFVLTSTLMSSAFANATFIKFDLKGLEGAKDATTQAMTETIQKEVIDECRAISSEDEVKLISEQVTERMVLSADVFRSSKIVLERRDSKNQYSYQIEIRTNWDQDLPSPQPEAVITQSSYCKWQPLYN